MGSEMCIRDRDEDIVRLGGVRNISTTKKKYKNIKICRADLIDLQNPLYHQPIIQRSFKRPYWSDWGCPNAERVCGRIIGLPMHPKLSEEDLEYICGVINTI